MRLAHEGDLCLHRLWAEKIVVEADREMLAPLDPLHGSTRVLISGKQSL